MEVIEKASSECSKKGVQMDITIRIVVGLIVLVISGLLWSFLFNLFTGLVNIHSLGFSRLIRRIFGLHVNGHSAYL